LNDAFVVAGGSVDVRTLTNGNITVRSTGSGTVSLSSGAGNQFIQVNATGVYASPSFRCPSYLNTNTSNSTVTRTAVADITAGLAQLPLDGLGSAQLQIPVGPLFSGGCVPQLLKVKISNLTFGSIITGSCNPANPFTIYFYQGVSTDWDTISSKALASFTYTNQAGTISTVGGYVTVPEVNIPFINAGQVTAGGGDIKVWYYSYFTGFFGPASGPQATFSLSVVL
jgi:hypothetical protein